MKDNIALQKSKIALNLKNSQDANNSIREIRNKSYLRFLHLNH